MMTVASSLENIIALNILKIRYHEHINYSRLEGQGIEAKAKAKSTIFCPRTVLEVKDPIPVCKFIALRTVLTMRHFSLMINWVSLLAN